MSFRCVDQVFVQSHLDENVFLRLPKSCGKLSGKIIRLNKSLYGSEQTPHTTLHAHLTMCIEKIGFEQCMRDVCVFCLIENGLVSISAVVVYFVGIFAVGLKVDVIYCVMTSVVSPSQTLGELKWYRGCHYSRDRGRVTLTISQHKFAEELNSEAISCPLCAERFTWSKCKVRRV